LGLIEKRESVSTNILDTTAEIKAFDEVALDENFLQDIKVVKTLDIN